ncbi:MAG: ABC transporter ATP-binding protein [Vulcanimicrobiota bacterium]
MKKTEVEVKSLTKKYGNVEALKGISLKVGHGEIFGLVGPDGAGKTTLLKILMGILSYDGGEVLIDGEDSRNYIERIRNKLGYISQNFSLYGDLTVEENIDFFARLYPEAGDISRRKSQLLDFIGLDRFKDRLAANLSGGMKQKLALLCGLIHKPPIMIMDEPTTGIDPVSRREFWKIIFQLQKDGLTVVSSTPYMDEAEQFNKLALIHKGEILKTGSADQIRKSVPGQAIEVLCDKPIASRRLLQKNKNVKDVELFGDKIHIFVEETDDELREEITRILEENGIKVGKAEIVGYSMEDVFLILTSPDGAMGGVSPG